MSVDLVVRAVAGLAAVAIVCRPAVPLVVAWLRAHSEQIRASMSGWPVAALGLALAYVAFVVGVVTAAVLRRRRPQVYARIGRQDI